MASPHMAGVVALMRAVCPTLTPAQLDGALSSGAITVDLGTAGRDDTYGNGFIDAFAAVQWASTPANCAGTTGTPTTVITASPSNVDFVPGGATFVDVTVVKSGADTVTGVVVTGKPAWLSITPPGAPGTGSYRLTPSTSGLANGVYSATLTFTATFAASSQKVVTVPVTLQVGAVSATSNAGYLYILLISAADPTKGFQLEGSPTAGSYPISFTGVPAGKYYLVAGSDSNNDGYICDAGESCGAYPTLAQPAEIDAATSPRSLNFQVGFTAALGGASAEAGGGLVIPPEGLKVTKLRSRAVAP
jgi:serine protease